jgi:hypothetical protein
MIALSTWGAPIPEYAPAVLSSALAERLRLIEQYPVIFAANRPGEAGVMGCCPCSPDGGIEIMPANITTPAQLLDTYCHELAHRLIRAVDVDFAGHNRYFAALYALLLRRASGHLPVHDRILSLSLYDVADEPESQHAKAIDFALRQSAALAGAAMSAEDCARAIDGVETMSYLDKQQWLLSLSGPDWRGLRRHAR